MQVIAHRGSSGAFPEHTLQAFEAAIADGVDGLECDVRLTRDGVLVCVHDRKVNRTSDGRGVVSALELKDLHELDFASWKDRERDPQLEDSWQEADRDAGKVLTFERLLQLVLDHDRVVQLQVEAKHPTRYGALVERGLVEVLDRYGLTRPRTRSSSRVAVLSFALTSLRRIHALAPRLPTVLNMHRLPLRLRDGTLPPHVWAAAVDLPLVQSYPRYVDRVHSRGGRVHVFTVDNPADIDYVRDLGVDAIISNEPARVLRMLGRAA